MFFMFDPEIATLQLRFDAVFALFVFSKLERLEKATPGIAS